MRRTLQRAARLLMAAGALGLAHPALAGSTPDDGTTADSMSLVSAVTVHPSQVALEAMRVEMAWLGDLTTFGHKLEVVIKPDTLEVHGLVPDETVHQQAMRVARQHSYMPVVDAITVATPVTVPGTGSPEETYRRVVGHLTNEFGERAAGFDIRVLGDGQVLVLGAVASVEDKLAVSRSLRQVPGCKAVQNELTVATVVRSGVAVTMVTKDGNHMVRGPLLASQIQSASAASPAPVQNTVAQPTAPQAVHTPHVAAGAYTPAPRVVHQAAAPIVLPPAPTLVLPSGLPPLHVRPAGHTEPASPSMANVIRPLHYTVTEASTNLETPAHKIILTGAAATPTATSQGVVSTATCPCTQGVNGATAPTPRRRLWNRITSWRSAPAEQGAVQAAPVPATTTTTAMRLAPVPTSAQTSVPTTAPTTAGVTATKPAAQEMIPGTKIPRHQPPAVAPPAHSIRSQGSSAPVQQAPVSQPKEQASRSQQPVSFTQSAQGSGKQTVTQSPAPAPVVIQHSSAPAPVVNQTTTAPTTPLVTQPPSAPAGSVQVKGMVTEPVDPNRLVQLVKKACGSQVRKVQAIPQPDRTLKVVVEIANTGGETNVIEKLLQIPEMTAPGVKFDLHIAP